MLGIQESLSCVHDNVLSRGGVIASPPATVWEKAENWKVILHSVNSHQKFLTCIFHPTSISLMSCSDQRDSATP